jgi:hypothetical protein
MKNFQIIKINDDSSIKVEYLKTDYIDIPNPDNLKGDDLVAHITTKVFETEVASDFLDPESGVLELLEINMNVPTESSIESPVAESESTDPV